MKLQPFQWYTSSTVLGMSDINGEILRQDIYYLNIAYKVLAVYKSGMGQGDGDMGMRV